MHTNTYLGQRLLLSSNRHKPPEGKEKGKDPGGSPAAKGGFAKRGCRGGSPFFTGENGRNQPLLFSSVMPSMRRSK